MSDLYEVFQDTLPQTLYFIKLLRSSQTHYEGMGNCDTPVNIFFFAV
jgi:hypothetical protein